MSTITSSPPTSSSSSSASQDLSGSIPYRSSRWPARFLVLTGIGHTIVGLVLRPIRLPLLASLQDGYFDAFAGTIERRHSFWFIIAGLNIVLIGKLVDLYLFPEDHKAPNHSKPIGGGSGLPSEKLTANILASKSHDQKEQKRAFRGQDCSERRLPREIGVWFLGLALGGQLAINKSGFFLLGLQGLAILLTK
ncbi:hypothetical protein EDD11_008155 [Mortierella claussenii]|nr:hypothetical protein EDD11_008155 [Mortierella claussenii]